MVLVQDSKNAPPRDAVALAEVSKVYPGHVAVHALDRVTVGFARPS